MANLSVQNSIATASALCVTPSPMTAFSSLAPKTGLVDLDESASPERQRLGPGEMILANPATGLFLRWRDILKRLAIQQARKCRSPKNV